VPLVTAGVATPLAWLAAIALAATFIALILLATRIGLNRSPEHVGPAEWVFTASVTGGSLSVLALLFLT